MDRVRFGINELDEAISGGIPQGNIVLVSGGAGTGKSTLAIHFLINGALNGERGIFISTEQNQDDLVKHASGYNLPLKKMIDSGLIRVVFINVIEEGGIIKKINEAVSFFKPKRLVIDSVSTFSELVTSTDLAREVLLRRGGIAQRNVDKIAPLMISEKTMVKRMLGMLMNRIRAFNSTVLLTSELYEKSENLSSDGITEFLSDGVLILKSLSVGENLSRTLEIKKMRYTKIAGGIRSYELTDSGFSMS